MKFIATAMFASLPQSAPVDEFFEVGPNDTLLNSASGIFTLVIGFILAILVGVGVWKLGTGMIKFFSSGDNPAKRSEGLVSMGLGVGALVMVFGGWAILGDIITEVINNT